MLTIFSTAKPFQGPAAAAQSNAIASWTQLRPRPEVILFGDEPGVAEICEELDLRHVSNVERSESGVPFVSDIFAQAQRLARGELMCYANSDIVFMGDFMNALRRILLWRRRGLLMAAGTRWNTWVHELIDFSGDWETAFRNTVAKQGEPDRPWALDYFVFTRGVYPRLPPFTVGRPAWDNYMVYAALRARARVVDLTPVVMAVHQRHDYGPGGQSAVFSSEDALRNRRLAMGPIPALGHTERFGTVDATHVLTSRGFEAAWRTRGLGRWLPRALWRLPLVRPSFRRPFLMALAVYRRVRPARVSGRLVKWLTR